jgi:hypothetical protein
MDVSAEVAVHSNGFVFADVAWVGIRFLIGRECKPTHENEQQRQGADCAGC